MKTIILLFLLLISSELYSQGYTYYYFYSKQEEDLDRKRVKSWGLFYTSTYLVVGKDTILFTQTAYSPEPSRKFKDLRYIGCGVYDKYEWSKDSTKLYARMIKFKRNG